MRKTRVYQNNFLESGMVLSLDATASHHLIHVLRYKPGMNVFLFNGSGQEYQATILNIQKKEMTVSIGEKVSAVPESTLKIHLGQAISRGERMDYTLQKAVELGVTSITPLMTEFCSFSSRDEERSCKKLHHWEKIIISAAEQCGRCILPSLNPPIFLLDWLAQAHANGLVLAPQASCTLSEIKKQHEFTLLIGSEGGLSATEIELAQAHGFKSISLGPRILRTETASIATIASLQSRWGDMG